MNGKIEKRQNAFQKTIIHLLWVLAITAAFALLLRQQSAHISLIKEADGFAVAAPDSQTLSVRYEWMDELLLMPKDTWPAYTAENRRGNVIWGEMEENTRFVVYESIPVGIWISQDGQHILFNYENESATRQLYEQILFLTSDRDPMTDEEGKETENENLSNSGIIS